MIWVEEETPSDQETTQSEEAHETDLLHEPENENVLTAGKQSQDTKIILQRHYRP